MTPHYRNVVLEIAREMFADAHDHEERAAQLPRWRWLKRHNLRQKAWTTRMGASLFMRDHMDGS